MSRVEDLRNSEKVERLTGRQQLALEIVLSEIDVLQLKSFKDVAIDVVYGMKEDDLHYNVLAMAGKVITSADFEHCWGENGVVFQDRGQTPVDKWRAVKEAFLHKLLNSDGIEFKIQKAFFFALWANHPEAAKFNPSPPVSEAVYFAKKLGYSREATAQAWEDLCRLGIVKIVCDPGERYCHWELDQNYYQAFTEGMKVDQIGGIGYTYFVFGNRPSQSI